jgi:hypothetical protein
MKGNWMYSVHNNPVQNQTIHLFSVVFSYYKKRFYVLVRQIALFCPAVFKMLSTEFAENAWYDFGAVKYIGVETVN